VALGPEVPHVTLLPIEGALDMWQQPHSVGLHWGGGTWYVAVDHPTTRSRLGIPSRELVPGHVCILMLMDTDGHVCHVLCVLVVPQLKALELCCPGLISVHKQCQQGNGNDAK
jgi:hypothetical protein